VAGILEGLSHTDSWRRAHPHARGKRDNHRIKAYQLVKQPHVQRALAEARLAGAAEAHETHTQWLARSHQLEELSVVKDQMSAAARLHEARGKSLGFVPTGGVQIDIDARRQYIEPFETVRLIEGRFGAEAGRIAAQGLGVIDFSSNSAEPFLIEGQAPASETAAGALQASPRRHPSHRSPGRRQCGAA
jgi:hypothetical protein